MESITPPPSTGPARQAWSAAMRQVLAYRDRYQITDPAYPLGPTGQEGERGDAYAIAARALESITLPSGAGTRPVARPGPRPLERVPVVLADERALRSDERRRQEADERARRDHADRERERAAERAW
jgi:hypothetical protein